MRLSLLTVEFFLRVWQDQFWNVRGKDCVLISRGGLAQGGARNGFFERQHHIALIRSATEGYGVVCIAGDTKKTKPRKIKSFDEQLLVKFGEIFEDEGDTFATVAAFVPVDKFIRQKTKEIYLVHDLQMMVDSQRKIDVTMREALVCARVGQGVFRKQVLANWGGVCAVTGSTVLDAIRASHIKPWRDSTDEERLDPFNGIPLVASLDALFDAGLITFDQYGTLLVSSYLNSTEQTLFALRGKRLCDMPTTKTAAFLEYHRASVFRE